MQAGLSGKNIILGVTGGIAAYKAAFLTRLFIKAGANVQVVMTQSATEFITPLTLSTLSKRPVITSITTGDNWNNHVEIGLWADAMVIAPVTANTMGKLANGLADNMLVATYLSARCPIFLAPAMDVDMWHHASTKNNLQFLESAGNHIIPVGHGELASGLVGEGRMAEVADIYQRLVHHFTPNLPLQGKSIMITAGPTREAIDPVRFIGNRSTGKMGIALAETAATLGADVQLILGPSDIPVDSSVNVTNVVSAQDMYDAAVAIFPNCDVAIMAAAVADYTPAIRHDEKMKKGAGGMSLELERTKDIAGTIGDIKENQIIIGFALETENELINAKAKLEKKNFDFIVINSLKDPGAGFGHDTNKIVILFPDGSQKKFSTKSKKEVSKDILDCLIQEVMHVQK
jgi:phosphopantothenoylcysteine decarboxylase/phosphopantothenate--cysteine ligase